MGNGLQTPRTQLFRTDNAVEHTQVNSLRRWLILVGAFRSMGVFGSDCWARRPPSSARRAATSVWATWLMLDRRQAVWQAHRIGHGQRPLCTAGHAKASSIVPKQPARQTGISVVAGRATST